MAPSSTTLCYAKARQTAFAGLPSVQRELLGLLAVCVTSMSRTRLTKLAREVGLEAVSRGQSVLLKDTVDEWVKAGFVYATGSGLECSDAVLDAAMSTLVDAGSLPRVARLVEAHVSVWQEEEAVRATRLRLYGAESRSYYAEDLANRPDLIAIAVGRFPSALRLAIMSAEERLAYLLLVIEDAVDRTEPLAGGVLEFARQVADDPPAQKGRALRAHEAWVGALAEYYCLRGDIDGATELLSGRTSVEACAAMVVWHWAHGDLEAAWEAGQTCLGRRRGNSKPRLAGLGGPLWACMSLATGDPLARKLARELVDVGQQRKGRFQPVYVRLAQAARVGRAGFALSELPPSGYDMRWQVLLFEHVLARWRGLAIPKAHRDYAQASIARADAGGFPWVAEQWTAALDERRSVATATLRSLMQPRPAWQDALDSIEALCAGSGATAAAASHTERLVWLIAEDSGRLWAEPRLQKRNKKGWSKGRVVALRGLAAPQLDEPWFADADRRVASFIVEDRSPWGGPGSARLSQTALALVGHPLVFWANDPAGDPVELVRAEPKLEVQRRGDSLVLSMVPAPRNDGAPAVSSDGPSRLVVVTFSDQQRRLADVVGKGLSVPTEAEERVAQVISGVSRVVSLHSDIASDCGDFTDRPPDMRMHVQLWRRARGLRVRVSIYPLGRTAPGFEPGVGAVRMTAIVDDEPVACTRDVDVECDAVNVLLEACPTLAMAPQEGRDYHVSELEDCLELLLALRDLDNVIMEWPAGQKLAITDRRGGSELRVRVRSDRGWFVAEGQLTIDDDLVMDMGALLDAASKARGRFIELSDDRYVALTDDVRRRLSELEAFSTGASDGGAVKLHALAAAAVEGLSDAGAQITTTRAVSARLDCLREAHSLQPAVPSHLHAELRDYQRDGYEWMMRLAHWGAGACLADDMGLGKTVQALALLVARASDGPALVVAPTSVCHNWHVETQRFAPTLTPQLFGAEDAAMRETMVKAAGPGDVLLVSYGLLVHARELLTGRSWNTLVLDEAQAIKNPRTQRARAARAIDATFRLATTGTPVENHVGDIWSIFAVLNPGLLGTEKSFDKRFMTPIHRHGDRRAAQRLRRLLLPFILRRRKSEVLSELPPRTDITLRVEPKDQERALYEAARRAAVERLSDDADPKQRMRIFAELMRLRRGACHPELLMPGCGLPSAKHEALDGLLAELLDGGHRALIFSQFVDHLAIVRARLDEREITYQYLDGSTPAAARQTRVQAFQAGQGDLFLISLKAGGSGLNLTGADYVIHLDPWWNPAVEDQASDRAHRIGQSRPVTVYRLVSAGTVEDRIVALHGEKRDLADRLLAGTDTSSRLGPEELLALLRERE